MGGLSGGIFEGDGGVKGECVDEVRMWQKDGKRMAGERNRVFQGGRHGYGL